MSVDTNKQIDHMTAHLQYTDCLIHMVAQSNGRMNMVDVLRVASKSVHKPRDLMALLWAMHPDVDERVKLMEIIAVVANPDK
jgi:hypothetical protein